MSSKNFAAQLLLTASLLGVGLTAPNMAEAAGLTVNANQGTLNTAVELDFIDINAQIAGDLNINFDMPDTTLSLIAVNMNDVAAEITGNLNIASGVTVSASQTGILAAGGGLIGGVITNNGKFDVFNYSNGVDAHGIMMTAATQFDFANNGDFYVRDQSAADAGATGISVTAASVTGPGALRVNNQGDLRINADDNVGLAVAATVNGIILDGTFFGDASADLTNDGNLFVFASAFGETDALAHVEIGLRLQASATGPGSSAAASLQNSSDLRITADANATNTAGNANAVASMTTGISQTANGILSAIVDLTNSGNITIQADAFARATSLGATATATANMDYGIYQIAEGLAAGVSLDNAAGQIDIISKARAVGDGSANATASMSSAMFQSALGGDTATVNLTNSATFNILIEASATANSGYANAVASINSQLIDQIANASNEPGSHSLASVALVNTGNLNIDANAFARGSTADATASYYYTAIAQSAHQGLTASALIQNDSDLTIRAHARAEGDNVSANAVFTSFVISQSASSNNGNGVSATADLTNSGTFSILAQATAVGFSGNSASSATASALFNGDTVIAQSANDASTVAARLANTGDFEITARAFAAAETTTGNAKAFASFASAIISQDASAGNDEISALAEITNTSNLSLLAQASARGGSAADATASINSTAIQQTAEDGASSIARIANSGNLSIKSRAQAFADVTNAIATATAGAYLAGAINQSATAGGDANSATVEIVNSGNMEFVAQATAIGLVANATASMDGRVIDQGAEEGDDNLASLRNTAGSLDIRAEAQAFGENVFAQAFFDSAAIAQHATGSTDHHVSAIAELVNSADLNIRADAFAGGFFGSMGTPLVSATQATAQATFDDDVIAQDAASASTVVARLSNTGNMYIVAQARATATSGVATATAKFAEEVINQDAIADYDRLSALAELTNSGDLEIAARASARGGTSAFALASITEEAISQDAQGGDVSRAIVDNSGNLEIRARARAYADIATATAAVDTGIHQHASAGGDNTTASVELVNSAGYLGIIAGANAGSSTDVLATSAEANAKIETGIFQTAESAINNLASIHNSADLEIVAWASAFAEQTAQAYAKITSYGIKQSATGNTLLGSVATVDLTNDGNLRIRADAVASATNSSNATATATIDIGVYQSANGATTRIASITNSGDFEILARAYAESDDGTAVANATIDVGISQLAYAPTMTATAATAELANSGDFAIRVQASAEASRSATAFASMGTAIYQSANAQSGDLATALLTNSGDMNLTVSARAESTDDDAKATATFGTGISQNAYDANVALASLVNTAGFINIRAEAFASAVSSADANAILGTGIWQRATADGGMSATASLANSADLNISVSARAIGETANATAQIATTLNNTSGGIYQLVSDASNLLASINNSGNLDISAFAIAVGSDSAFASALVNEGIWQNVVVSGTTGVVNPMAVAEVNNSGNLNFRAEAYAGAVVSSTLSGGFDIFSAASLQASATASIGGIHQFVPGAIARLTNTSEIIVSAYAEASASSMANANAFVRNIFIEGNSAAAVGLEYDNQGSIVAQAYAEANGTTGNANADATAILVNSNTVSGRLENSGEILAFAIASGANETASAIAVNILADNFDLDLVNTGTILAIASEANSGTAMATAIRVATHTAPGGAGIGSITNDGGLIVAVHDALNMNYGLGNAINVEPAPHAMTINLMGTTQDGRIVGHIDLSVDDTINVTSGKTLLTGEINPDGTNEGTLNINSNGELWLKLDDDFGETFSNVADFNIDSTGTLAIGVNAAGESNQLQATNASLDGTLLIDTNAGIYGNAALEYEDVFLASNRINDFALVAANSPLFTVSYVAGDESPGGNTDWDIDLTRVAFNAAAGLTPNQNSVATMLEGLYNPGNGGIDELVTDDPAAVTGLEALMAELFSLNPEEYQAALDDLSGAEHGVVGQQYMRSFGVLDGIIGDVLRNRGTFVQQAALRTGESADGPYINPTAASAALIDPSKGGFWTRAQGSFASGDEGNSPAFDAAQGSIYFGADANLDGNTVLGALAGYVNGKQDFADSDSANYDGFQVGLYGQHDWEATYFRALAVYGSADVSVDRSGTIGILSGASAANYDANAWHVSGEVGHQWMMSGNSAITPFVGLAYSSYDSENFVETGTPGASLEANVDGDSLLGNIGLRLTSEVDTAHGIIRPEFMLAWEHEFLDFSGVNASISGVSGSTFAVTGGDETSNLAVIGAGLGFDFSESVSMKLNYTGRLGNDYQDHTMFGQLRMEF